MDQGLLGKIGNKIGSKVDDTSTTKLVDASTSAPDNKNAAPASVGDTVELTSGGKLLEKLEKTLTSLPDVDRARVDAVKSQIENGEYQIDADRIAAAMLRLDQEIDGG